MKKLTVVLLALVLLAAVGGSAFAWDSWQNKGDVSVGVGVGVHFPFGLAVYPGVEWVFANWKAGDTVPFSFGLAGRGLVDWWADYGVGFGGAAFLTGHLGLKGLDIPDFLQKLDFYVGLGVSLVYASWYSSYWGSTGDLGVWFANMSGVAWYFKPNMALYLEYNYWRYSGGALGLLWKL